MATEQMERWVNTFPNFRTCASGAMVEMSKPNMPWHRTDLSHQDTLDNLEHTSLLTIQRWVSCQAGLDELRHLISIVHQGKTTNSNCGNTFLLCIDLENVPYSLAETISNTEDVYTEHNKSELVKGEGIF